MYRSWDRDWGFCVTKRFYDGLLPGEYEVSINTDESEGTLKILECTHPGDLAETIVFAAHLDHPGMANDDLAGCAVGVELLRRLRQKRTKYTYKLVLHQEVIGAEYYLGGMEAGVRDEILEGLFLEMLGTSTQLALQASRGESTGIESALAATIADKNMSHRQGAYASIVVNGEYVWDAYGIPMASLSRYPYPQYHTSLDNASIVSHRALVEVLEIILEAIDRLESWPILLKRFSGSICVSNPRYDLYVDPGQPAFGGFDEDVTVKKLRDLMDLIPSLHRPLNVCVLADKTGLDEVTILGYLQKWAEKGLIELR
jgi:aminopeptidase-like protein